MGGVWVVAMKATRRGCGVSKVRGARGGCGVRLGKGRSYRKEVGGRPAASTAMRRGGGGGAIGGGGKWRGWRWSDRRLVSERLVDVAAMVRNGGHCGHPRCSPQSHRGERQLRGGWATGGRCKSNIMESGAECDGMPYQKRQAAVNFI